MAISLEKKLEKGERFNLEKNTGDKLTNFCVGVNWGAIEYQAQEASGFLGFGKKTVTKTIDVDLDLSCVLIDANKNVCDHIYSPLYKPEILQKFGLPKGKLDTSDRALHHSGDDLEGDKGGDDGLDNEIITVDLNRLNSNVEQIFFFLNNVGKEDFAQIPYAKIRIYEGTPSKVGTVFASYNVSAESQYVGKRALIMGKLYKKNNEWKFNAIGDAYDDQFLGQTIQRIVQSYLK
ncbi:MAG: TerD family protein [Dysgonamonadaceae bacterium]|jgi:tellurium resistance protein TerZ|nr:TerD family protein [Dysgonamonadaceae bacterium]